MIGDNLPISEMLPREYPSSSQNYLTGRQAALDRIVQCVQMGNCCRVLGPRFREKSKLMRGATTRLQNEGTHHAVYLSLLEIPFDSETSFFSAIYQRVHGGISPTRAVSVLPESALAFQFSLLNLVWLNELNIAIFIDDLEIPPPNLVASLLGALRAAFMINFDQPGARFQAVVCGSLSLSQVALDSASRFETISDLVIVGDHDQIERYAQVKTLFEKANVRASEQVIQAILTQTEGDPILIGAITQCTLGQVDEVKDVTPAEVEKVISAFLTSPLEWVVIEVFRQIETNPSLLTCLVQILSEGEVSASKLPIDIHEIPTPLDLCGAFTRIGNCYKIKSQLWVSLLRNHFHPRHIGGLYAIIGQWRSAVRYLGQAIQNGQTEAISELFTATINFLNASENIHEAFTALAIGIETLYPHSNLKIYYRVGNTLEMVYPNPLHRLSLADASCLEVQALRGPEYSVAYAPPHTRCLIPLRNTNAAGRSIGLVSFLIDVLHDPNHHHLQREEINQLIRFLQQATKGIDAKIRMDGMVAELERVGKARETRAKIATSLIHDIYSAVGNIPDLVNELQMLLRMGEDTDAPLRDLRIQAYKTHALGRKLKEFTIKGVFESKFIKLEAVIKKCISDLVELEDLPRIQYEMNSHDPEIWADELWLDVLLRNLLINAFEATLNYCDGDIRVFVKVERARVYLRVQDKGYGIPAEHLSRIFDFGFTTKDSGQMRGIGLNQCRQITGIHGGELTVESELGVGSVFTLSLPIGKPHIKGEITDV